MKKLQFKTNISCNGCIEKVTPYLDSNPSVKKWEVDTKNPDKVLTVEGEDPDSRNIIAAVRDAGYTIEAI